MKLFTMYSYEMIFILKGKKEGTVAKKGDNFFEKIRILNHGFTFPR